MIAKQADIATETAGVRIVNEPAEVYHAHPAISRSMLCDFIEGRRIFEGRYIKKTIPPKEPTDAMELGTLVHSALLEPDRLHSQYVAYPVDVLAKNGARSGNACKQFEEECHAAGITPLKAEQLASAVAMVASVHATCGKLLGHKADIEQSIYWTDEFTGLELRCRLDWRRVLAESQYIFDVKASPAVSPWAFRKKFFDMHYWAQVGHYTAGAQAAKAIPAIFHFVVVEPKPPYRTSIHKCKPNVWDRSNIEWRKALMDLAGCLESGDWSEAWEGEVNEIDDNTWDWE